MIRYVRPFVVLAAFVAALTRGDAQEAPASLPASAPADPLAARSRDRDALRLAVAPPGLERGDYDAAVSAILDRIAADADKLGFAEALLARASALMERAADRFALEEKAAKLLANEKIPGLARYRLEHFRAAAALRAGEEAPLLRGGDFFPGNVTSFACIGPLGDAFPDALAVPFEPEKGLSLGASAQGLGGVECLWKTITRRPFEPYVDLAPLGGPPQGVRYAKTQLRSSSAHGAYLLLGAPSSHAMWWNGEEVARSDWAVESRGFRGPIPIVVRQGWNEALVKLEGGTTVSLRVVDDKGRPLAGLDESTEMIDRAVPPLSEPTPKPRAYADSASKLTTWLAAQDDVDARALRGFIESVSDRSSEALVDLRAAAAAAPERPEIGVLLAEALLTAPHLPPSEAKNRAREAVDRVLAKSPAYVPALLLRADLLARDDRMEEALAALDEADKAAPASFLAPRSKAVLFQRLGWPAEATRALNAALKRAPRHMELHLDLARQAQQEGNHAKERKELETVASLDVLNRAARERLADLCLRGEEGALAISVRERFVRIFGTAMDRAALASTLEAIGRGKEAEDVLRQITQSSPRDAAARVALARLERANGDDAAALATYRRALETAPATPEARAWFREIDGRLEGDELFERYRADVAQAVASYAPAPDHAKSPDVLVVDLQIERVLADGSSEIEVTSVYRINDARGVEAHGNARFRGELLSLRVLHPDGTVDEPTPAGGDYALPNLAPGDFVAMRFRFVDAIAAGARPLLGRFRFQSTESPYVLSRYVLALPKGSDVRIAQENFDGEHEVVESGGDTVHVFTKRNSDRILPENFAPDEIRYVPWVRAGVSQSPEQLNRYYRSSVLREIDLTEEIKAAAEKALADRKAKTDREKAEALYELTNDTLLERTSNMTATRSLLEKRGSALALFGALCRAQGIPFELGIARGITPIADDELRPDFRTIDRYRQPMLRVRPRDGGEPVWVDFSLREQPFGAIPGPFSGAEIFVTGAAGGVIEHLPPLPDSEGGGGEVSCEVQLLDGQAADVRLDFILRNVQAWGLRERVRNLSNDERRSFAIQVANSLDALQGIEVEKTDFPTLEDRAAPFRIHVEGHVPNFLRKGATSLEAPVALEPANLAKQFGGRSKRRLPLKIRQTRSFRDHLRILASESTRFGELPEAVTRKEFTTSFALRVSKDGSALEVDRVLTMQPGEIAAADVPSFLAFCRSIDEAMLTKVPVLEK